MKSIIITIGIGYFYIVISIMRLIIEVPTLFIALLSIAAALFTLADYYSDVKSNEKWATNTFVSGLVFLIASLVSLLPIPVLNNLTGFWIVQRAGDWATLFGLGIVVITIGYKEMAKTKLAESLKVQEEQVPPIDTEPIKVQEEQDSPSVIVKKMNENEYNTMMELNDVITQLKKIDPHVFGNDQVYNGWSVFYDILVDFYNAGGPFYDGLNRQLFSEFLESLDSTTEIIVNLADPDFDDDRDLGDIVLRGTSYEIYSQSSINYIEGPTVQDVVEKLDETLERWKSLKDNITKQYEQTRV
ncbi:hypothetical protein Q0V21_30655 [Paenibacillus sp. 11B]|uniref:hypothetical protein n=1 Tax=Paenibacillus sp. 11B TaxID=3060965 RepID=UPI00264DDE7C|nr:hypothetical protein [Paenibacillus sp. 11B]MDN8593092.1 hypothetical protein [Paenibacillus sp. 11B]